MAVARWLLARQGWLLGPLLAASFVARGPLIALPFAGVLVLWGARWLVNGRPWLPAPFNRPLAVLLGFSFAALLPSVDLALSLTRLGNLLLGIALVQALLAGERAAVPWRRIFAGLLAVNWLLLPLLVGGTDWGDKASLLGAGGYAQLPRWLPHVFTNSYGQAQAGVQPNQLAAVLAILLPMPLMLLRMPPPAVALAAAASGGRLGRLLQWLATRLLRRRALVALAVLSAAAILLTQSRSAWIGLALSQALLWGWPYRRRLLPLAAAAIVGTMLLVMVVPAWHQEAEALFTPAGPQHYLSNTLAIRVEIWQRSVRMLADYPLTGIGLNTFPKIQPALYPVFSFARTAYELPTAHSLYLQTLLDYGIPGALALAAFLLAVGRSLSRSYRAQPAWRGVALALGAAGLAWLGYGLLDVLDLGAKGAYILWVGIALVAKLAAEPLPATPAALQTPRPRRFRPRPLALLAGAAALALLVVLAPRGMAATSLNAASIAISKGALGPHPEQEAAALPALQTSVSWWRDQSGAYYEQGRVALASGDYGAAQGQLETALAHSPRDGLLHYLLGEAYQRGGQPDQAAAEWHQANAWFVVFPQRVAEGLADLDQGQVDHAATALAQAQVLALDLDPGHRYWLADLYRGLAAVHLRRGEQSAAEENYALARSADPHNVGVLVEAGEFYVQSGRVAVGLSLVEQAARENPQNYWSALKLANLYTKLGRSPQAIAAFVQAQALAPPDATTAQQALARLYLAAGRPADAAVVLRQALAISPADGELYFLLGNAQQAVHDQAGSCASWSKAAQLAPASAPFSAELRDKVRGCGASSRSP